MSEVKTAPAPIPPAEPVTDPAELARWHDIAEAVQSTFGYVSPDQNTPGRRASYSLCQTDLFRARVVIVKKNGGETNLHYHTNSDGFWFVLKGRARFYGPGDSVTGEFGPHEGTSTPRYTRYWFENCGDEDLEMLHLFINSVPGRQATGRTDAAPRPDHLPPIGVDVARFDAAKR